MDIAFLGTGRMGTELALHLIGTHDVMAWNRTPSGTTRVQQAGASVAQTAAEAVAGRPVVITVLFGPASVREVVVDADLLAAGTVWIDSTTVSPDDAREFADWAGERGVRYVHAPVVGTLGPARNGALGVYVGSEDDGARELAVDVVRPWADPARLKPLPSAEQAAAAKLLANLALAVSMQGLVEALRLGRAQGFNPETVLDLLASTGLAFPAGMKRRQVLTADFDPADFTADALAKDIRLMLRSSPDPLPATTAALESFTTAQRQGRGDSDISVIFAPEVS